MRVALVIDALRLGGAEQVVAALARGLAQRGAQPFVYCLKEAGPLAPRLRAAGIPVRAAEAGPRDLTLPLRLRRWFSADRVQCVHVHSRAALAWTLPVARLMRLPVVDTRHGALLGDGRWYGRAASLLAPFVTQTVLVAETLRSTLRPTRVAQAAVVVPNGIDRPPIAHAAARKALEELCRTALAGPVVLSVGTLCPEKDTLGLLRAFALLRARVPQARLICVGGTRGADYATALQRAIREHGLESAVLWPGPVTDAWRLMAGADVFCLSSVTEALPVAVVEAMSQRVPIVATAVGAVGALSDAHVGGDHLLHDGVTGRLVEPRRPDELAAALVETLTRKTEARSRAAHAHAHYRGHFSAAAMVAGYERVYAACVPQAGSARKTAGTAPRQHVLFTGPDAHAVGGMTGVIDNLMQGALQKYCTTARHAWPPARTAGVAQRPGRGLAATVGACVRHARSLLALARRIAREKPSIVHVHTCSGLTAYRALADVVVARLLRRRVVLHVHGGRFATFVAQTRGMQRALLAAGMRLAESVIVLTRVQQTLLPALLRHPRVIQLPNSVHVAGRLPHRAQPRGAACRFTYLGAQSPTKGLDDLLQAARRLRDHGVSFALTIAGPRPPGDSTDWQARAHDLGLADHVRFVGVVQGAAKRALLAETDCLVLPSYVEAFPLVVLEAGAAGCAVIATTVGAIPEIAARPRHTPDKPTTLFPLVAPGDVEALAGAMTRLAEAPRHCQALGRALRLRVKRHYADPVVAARLAALYAAPIAQPPRPITRDVRAGLSRVLYALHERLLRRRTLALQAELARAAANTEAQAAQEADARLHSLLDFAATLPHYADHCDAAAGATHSSAAERLRRVPVQSKADIRAAGDSAVCRTIPGGLIRTSSGGTTGDTLHFYVDRLRQAQDRAARLFMQSLFGVRVGARRAYLWGSPLERTAGRVKRLRDRALNELLLDAFELGPAQLAAHLRTLRRAAPEVLYGYTSAVTLLAEHIRRQGAAQLPSLKLVVLTGEEITDAQRATVKAAFGCPVAAEYGNREVGLIAHDCPAGGLHVIAPHIFVETVSGGLPVAPGAVGEIVCTNLMSRAQPLLRYRVGDVGRLADTPCTCGLPWPRLQIVGGKLSGFVALADGRLCHGAVSSHALQALPGIRAFRTHQRSLDVLEVLLVTEPQFPSSAIETIRARYRTLFGDQLRVEVRIVDELPPDPSGKRRHFVSDVAPHVQQVVLADTHA